MQNDNPTDPNPIHSVFAEQPGLRFMVAKTQQLQQINAVISSILPAEVSKHCQAQNLDGGCLVISTDHAAWATQLRYLQPQLLTALRQQPAFRHVGSVKIRVIPSVATPPRPSRRLRMSRHVGDLLSAAANGTSNEKLKAALLRLAAHASRDRTSE